MQTTTGEIIINDNGESFLVFEDQELFSFDLESIRWHLDGNTAIISVINDNIILGYN